MGVQFKLSLERFAFGEPFGVGCKKCAIDVKKCSFLRLIPLGIEFW